MTSCMFVILRQSQGINFGCLICVVMIVDCVLLIIDCVMTIIPLFDQLLVPWLHVFCCCCVFGFLIDLQNHDILCDTWGMIKGQIDYFHHWHHWLCPFIQSAIWQFDWPDMKNLCCKWLPTWRGGGRIATINWWIKIDYCWDIVQSMPCMWNHGMYVKMHGCTTKGCADDLLILCMSCVHMNINNVHEGMIGRMCEQWNNMMHKKCASETLILCMREKRELCFSYGGLYIIMYYNHDSEFCFFGKSKS